MDSPLGNQVPDLRWLYVAVIVTAVSVVVHRKKIDRPAWYGNGGAKLLIAYVAWMWVQYFWSIAPDLQIEGATLFSKHLIMYYLVYTIVEDEETLARFALANVVGCFYFGWLAMGESGRVEDLGGSVSNANTLGMHLTTGLMFAAFLFQELKNWMRWVAFATIPFILNAVILTQSRGTFLGLLGAGFVSFFLLPRSLRKGYYVSVGLGVVLFFILAHDQFLDRMSTMLNIGDETAEIDNSDASRIVIFQSGWEMAKDYPMGAGYRGTRILSPFYMDKQYLAEATGARSAHNTFMAALVEQGFPGGAIYLLLVFWTYKTLKRLKRMDRSGLPPTLGIYRTFIGASLAAAFISGQFTNFLQAEIQFWCLALLAVTWNLSLRAVQRKTDEGEAQELESGSAPGTIHTGLR